MSASELSTYLNSFFDGPSAGSNSIFRASKRQEILTNRANLRMIKVPIGYSAEQIKKLLFLVSTETQLVESIYKLRTDSGISNPSILTPHL